MSAVATQQAMGAWPSSQTKDIEDKSRVVFEAHSKTDEVDETELPELSAEEVIRMGIPAIPTS